MAKAGCKARRVFSAATIAAPLADVPKVGPTLAVPIRAAPRAVRPTAGPTAIVRAAATSPAARRKPFPAKSTDIDQDRAIPIEGVPKGAPFFVPGYKALFMLASGAVDQ